jgi:hypothetical protein
MLLLGIMVPQIGEYALLHFRIRIAMDYGINLSGLDMILLLEDRRLD